MILFPLLLESVIPLLLHYTVFLNVHIIFCGILGDYGFLNVNIQEPSLRSEFEDQVIIFECPSVGGTQ